VGVIPTSGLDVLGMDATAACKRLGIPSVHVINGWDNLSSKIVFPVKPDYLCVWGEQSKGFATSVHGIDPVRVYEVGSPQFDAYAQVKEAIAHGMVLERHYPFDHVLFAGCAVAFDEISALKVLDEAIEREHLATTIVYRPHPWRLPRSCPDDFYAVGFKHVVMDAQAVLTYLLSKVRGTMDPAGALPSLDYYPSLLHHARFVVCPLSTMMLEALYFGKDVLSIEYDDLVHLTSPRNLRRYDHFEGIDGVQGVFPCGSISHLGDIFTFLHRRNASPVDKDKLSMQLQHYIHSDATPYAERLHRAVVEAQGIASGKLHMVLELSTRG
jgi:hypothetical protein